MSDPTIERIEAELRESRTQAWDVETFLANRHRAKIEALTKPDDALPRAWEATKQLATMLCTAVGYITVVTVLGAWALTGEFPIRRGMLDRPAQYQVETADSRY